MLDQMEDAGLERLHFAVDAVTGMRAIIAIHSTRRGPAIGGCRFIPYADEADAVTDAIRLARGMSYKAALAGLPHGGVKAVVIKPDHPFDRRALMQAFGRMIEGLGGDYITAMDSGTQVTDMDAISETTRYVTCTSTFGDPSPYTALGVFEGIKASLKHRHGSANLEGCHVAIQGLGHVGYALARHLHQAGAELTVADINSNLVEKAVNEFDARPVPADLIYQVNADIFSPCGLGAILNDKTIDQLKTGIIAGSANNQLLAPSHGEQLHQRGILYAPDYLINAGGLIFVALHHAGQDSDLIHQKVLKIGTTLQQLYQHASQQNTATHQIADQQAEAIITQSTHFHPAA